MLGIAILIAAGAAYLWEVVTFSGIPIARDMQMFFIPQKRLLWEAYQAGEVPLWTPFIGTGAPFHANLQSGFFYPPHWLYALLPFYKAFNLLLVFHFVLGGTFAYLLFRRLGVGPVGCYVGAVTWMLGGYFVSLLNLVNALQAAAWAPGLAWAALRVLETRGVHAVAALVLVGVCAGLAGEPQSVLLALCCTGLVLTGWTHRRRPSREVLRAGALKFAVAATLILGLAMVQALPTLEFLRDSGRGTGLTLEQAAAFDLKPIRLIYLLVPTDFSDPDYVFGVRSIIGSGDPWLFSIYLGALFPILLSFAWRGSRRFEVALWTAAGLLAILVGLGDHTPVFPWLFEHVPGLGAFRFPEKYLLVTAFGAAILSAFGADECLRSGRRRLDALWAGVYVGLPLAAVGLLHANYDRVRAWALAFGNSRMAEDYAYAFGVWQGLFLKLSLLVALAVFLIWAYRYERLSRRWFGVLLCALVTGDLTIAHRNLNPVVELAFYEEEPEILRHIPLELLRRDFRYRSSRFDSLSGTLPVLGRIPLEPQKWLWQQIMGPNVGQPWGVLQQDAWDAIKLRRTEDERALHRVLEPERRWKLLRLQSVRYVHSIFELEAEGEAREIPLDTLGGHLYELRDPLPRAYVVPTASWTRDEVEAINRVLDPGFDLTTTVVLTDSAGGAGFEAAGAPAGDAELPPADGRVGSFPGATIVESSPHRIRIRLDGSRSGYAVLTDSFYPGWTARVDGEVRPIHLANFFFRAVKVRPGDREIVFTYRSRAYEQGRLVSLAFLIAAGGLWVVFGLRRRPPTEGVSRGA